MWATAAQNDHACHQHNDSHTHWTETTSVSIPNVAIAAHIATGHEHALDGFARMASPLGDGVAKPSNDRGADFHR